MRLARNNWIRAMQGGAVALALTAVTAGGALAQLTFDGNVVFQNNGTGTLAGQFVGTAGAGAPSCLAGTTAASIFTTTFTNNVYADPLLPNAPYKANVIPNFQPALGSPAFGSALRVPADGFFKQVCYKGAIGPNPGDDWTQGWTYWDSTGAIDRNVAARPLRIFGGGDCDRRTECHLAYIATRRALCQRRAERGGTARCDVDIVARRG